RVLEFHAPEFALEIVGRILRPDPLDHLDMLDQHAPLGGAVGLHAKNLRIRREAAGADPENEPAAAHVIELRGFRRRPGRMMVGGVDDADAELELAGVRQEARHEHQGRRVRLGPRGEMFADPKFVVAERVEQDRLFGVFRQTGPHRPACRVQRHHEHPETHVATSPAALKRAGGVRGLCDDRLSLSMYVEKSAPFVPAGHGAARVLAPCGDNGSAFFFRCRKHASMRKISRGWIEEISASLVARIERSEMRGPASRLSLRSSRATNCELTKRSQPQKRNDFSAARCRTWQNLSKKLNHFKGRCYPSTTRRTIAAGGVSHLSLSIRPRTLARAPPENPAA